jgi:FtsP/CotA-like multicopper oxidase with cupredoxin domain
MKKIILKKILTLAMALAAVVMMANYSMAVEVNLAAVNAQWLPPGETAGTDEIPMWGFIEDPGSCPAGSVPWEVGPTIPAVEGDPLTINLRNCLSEPVSIVIPGQTSNSVQRVFSGNRVTSLAHTTPADNGAATVSYVWNGLKTGSYIYHSGMNLSTQVQMGLYGGLIVNVTPLNGVPGVAYNGTTPIEYDNEVVMFFSEIDPLLHDSANPVPADPNNYKPQYFLINGQPYPDALPIQHHPLQTNERVLVRMFNAGLDDLVPTINGQYWDLVAEDGNPYPYSKKQVTALLSAMKTRDAILVADIEGTYPVFDRRLNLINGSAGYGGMMVKLNVGLAAGVPVVTIDSPANGTSFVQGTEITFTGSASDNGVDLTASLAWESSIDGSIGTGGTFIETGLSVGVHTITASVTDLDGNTGSKSVTVTVTPSNTAPVVTITAPANGSTFSDTETITFTGTANDAQDGDLSAGLSWASNVDGEIGTGASVATDQLSVNSHTITASVTDSGGLEGTSSVNVTVAVDVNDPPVANNDYATTTRNTAININVVSNDTDPDGNLDPTSVVVTGEEFNGTTYVATSTRGGTVTNLKNGTVVYEPRRNFQGTDTFTYIVFDAGGLQSNQATVQVNVTRR